MQRLEEQIKSLTCFPQLRNRAKCRVLELQMGRIVCVFVSSCLDYCKVLTPNLGGDLRSHSFYTDFTAFQFSSGSVLKHLVSHVALSMICDLPVGL